MLIDFDSGYKLGPDLEQEGPVVEDRGPKWLIVVAILLLAAVFILQALRPKITLYHIEESTGASLRRL
jgi:hypothetical protein